MNRRKIIRFVVLVSLALLIIYIFGLDEDRSVLNAIRHGLRGLLRAL